MNRLTVICVTALMFAGVACTRRQAAGGLKDLGTVKAGVDSVAVYLPDAARAGWALARDRVIDSRSIVYTVNDKAGKPKAWPVVMPKDKTLVRFMEVVFKAPESRTWHRGFVLEHCFNWDKTKNVDASVVAGAQDVWVSASRPAQPANVAPYAGRSFCRI